MRYNGPFTLATVVYFGLAIGLGVLLFYPFIPDLQLTDSGGTQTVYYGLLPWLVLEIIRLILFFIFFYGSNQEGS
jgi:hypothetical protein